MEKFYRFGHNSTYTRGFTWAYSIIPRSEIFEKTCQRCGGVIRYPLREFDVIVEGGTKYPDVLGCGAYPFLIVSEEVVNDWLDADIDCFTKNKVGIEEAKGKKIKDVKPLKYYRIEINGQCKMDLDASGLMIKQMCSVCGNFSTQPTLAEGFQMISGSWDGCNLFRDIELYPRVSFCTEKVMRLAGENKRTNFRFQPMEGPFDVDSKGIDYMKLYKKKKR